MEDSEKYESVEQALESFRFDNMRKAQALNSMGYYMDPVDIIMSRIDAIVSLLPAEEQAAIALQYEQIVGQKLSGALTEARKADLAKGASLDKSQVSKLAKDSGLIIPGN